VDSKRGRKELGGNGEGITGEEGEWGGIGRRAVGGGKKIRGKRELDLKKGLKNIVLFGGKVRLARDP
jgi:hypothetical protein